MQVGTFKKNKGGWLQELFAGLSRSPLLSKPIENTQRPWRNDIVRFELKGQEKMMHPPEIAFRIDSKLILKLRERLDRIRRPLQGLLVADSLEAAVNSFVELRADEEDAGAMQQAEGAFCVGVALSRGESEGEVQRRVKEELRRCSERSGAIFSQNSRDSALSQLSKATIRQMRVFLFFDQGREGLTVGRLLYFPRASIPIRKISITQPTALTGNDVLQRIKRTLNFKTDIAFGYISLNAGMAGDKHKFILLDRNDPELLTASPPVLGVWAAGALGTGLQREGAIWTVIMEYLTDPHLTKRLSVAGERSGLFFALDNPAARDRLTAYVFEFPANARWSISSRLESAGKLPQEYAFSQQEVIMEEEREESQVESIASRQERNRNGFDQNMETSSVMARALEEKDAEIKRLRVELDFYKTQYQKMQEAFKTMNMMQMAQQGQNSNLSTPPSYPYQQYEDGSLEEPFFGRRSHEEEDVKEFSVRDMKNISFAQEQSFEEEPPSSSILERQQLKLNTPEFRENRDVKLRPQDVKAFNAPKYADEAKEKERERQKEKERRQREREMEREIEREREREEREREREREKERKQRERESERERQRQRERVAEQRPISPSLIRSLQQKYGNYKTLSRNITNSPKLKQPIEDSGRKQQSQKSAPKRQDPKRAVFEEDPRDRRIKNELYSQEKDPRQEKQPRQEKERQLKKENHSSTNVPKKQASDVKSPQKKNGRSKSPLPEPPQKAKLLASDDEDDQQLAEIMSKRKKK